MLDHSAGHFAPPKAGAAFQKTCHGAAVARGLRTRPGLEIFLVYETSQDIATGACVPGACA